MFPAYRHRRQAVLAIVLAGTTTLILLALPLVAGVVFYGTDLMRSDVGYLCAIKDQQHRHEGLWISRTIGNGYFLWGHPVAQLLYPVRWLTLLFEPDVGASVGSIVHLAIGAAATTWLALTFRMRPSVAGLAGVAFAFSGPSLDLIQRTFCVVAAAWLPLAWAAGRQLLRPRATPRHVVLLGAALVLLLLGGEIHEFAVACAILLLELITSALRHRRRVLGRGVRLFATIGGAAAMGALVLLPAEAEAQLTPRQGLLSERASLRGSLSSASTLGLLFPDVVTHPVQPNSSLWNVMQGGPGGDLRWDPNPFLGAILIVAALVALRRRHVRMPVLLGIFGFVLAFGEHTPVLPVLLKVFPPLRLFRYPAKYALFGSLGLIIGAFATLQSAHRSPAVRRHLRIGLSVAALSMATGFVWTWPSGELLSRLATQTSAGAAAHEGYETLSGLLTHSIGIGLIWLVIALIAVGWRPLRPYLPLLGAAQLVVAAPQGMNLGPSLAEVRSPLAALEGPLCVDPKLSERTWTLPGQTEAQSIRLFQRIVGVTDTEACSGIASPVPYAPFQMRTTGAFNRELEAGRVSFARALGCSHFVSLAPEAGATEIAWPVEETHRSRFAGLHLLSVGDPLPEVFVAQGPRLVTERELFDSVGVSRTSAQVLSLVDDPLHRLQGSALPSGSGIDQPTTSGTGDRIEVRAHGSGPAVVGVRTSFLAGWTASQAGVDLPVVRVAGQQLGAVVPDVSRGPVEFRYRVPLLVPAFLCAMVGLILLAITALWTRRARLSV